MITSTSGCIHLQLISNSLSVTSVKFENYKSKITNIRNTIFVEEQNVPKDLEWDDLDSTAHHYIIKSKQDNIIAYARLLPSGKLGRVAVLREHRRHGIGSMLMSTVFENAAKLGMESLNIAAQVTAIDFYIQLGFQFTSEIYLEAGIEHRTMLKTLK